MGLFRADGRYEFFNEAWRERAGIYAEHFLSSRWIECLHEADRHVVHELFAKSFASRNAYDLDIRLVENTGARRWYRLRLQPAPESACETDLWLCILRDIHQRKQREIDMERRLTAQSSMLDATRDCIKLISTDGTLMHMNKAGCAALSVNEASGFGMKWLSLLPEDIHEAGEEALRIAASGQSSRFPGMSAAPGENVRHWDNMLTPLLNRRGETETILCVSRDVTSQWENERRIELLLQELNHRSKNMLSVVQALIRRSVPDPQADFVVALEQRLVSIARSQDMLVNGEWVGMTVCELVRSQTTIVGDVHEKRIIVRGDPGLRLRANAAGMLGLALHELATNALKYGALSNDRGVVTISWTLMDGAGTGCPQFCLRWVESGGPEVSSPRHRGFGTAIIGRNPLSRHGVNVTHAFERSGVRWEVSAPVADILAITVPQASVETTGIRAEQPLADSVLGSSSVLL